jgi:hypothetical protein
VKQFPDTIEKTGRVGFVLENVVREDEVELAQVIAIVEEAAHDFEPSFAAASRGVLVELGPHDRPAACIAKALHHAPE